MAINFDVPQTISNPATKLDITSYTVTGADIKVKLNWLDANGAIVKSGSVNIGGADYTEVMTDKITAGQVDKRTSKVMKKLLIQKVKSMLSVAGTIDD